MPLAKHKGNMLECLENCRAWPTEGEAGVAAGLLLRPKEQGAGPPKGVQAPAPEMLSMGGSIAKAEGGGLHRALIRWKGRSLTWRHVSWVWSS